MSDLSEGGSSVLIHLADFSGGTRLYEIDTPLGPDKLLVENFIAQEALSSLYEYRITCLSTDIHIELKRLIAQQIVLHITMADGAKASRSGWVSRIEQLGADGGLARFRLTMTPWLWMATQRRTSRVFQDKGVLQIVEEVLATDAPRNNWRATPDAEALLAKVRPRSYCCQYRETDYAFFTRLLAEEGIGFHFEEDDSGHPAQQRLVLFANSTAFTEDHSSQHANGGRGIRFHREAAVEIQDSIQKFGCERISQAEITTISGWDYKAKRVVAASLPSAQTGSTEVDAADAASAVENCDWLGLYPFATQAEAEHYARILREAMDARAKTWFGEGTVRSFRPGTAFDLTEAPFAASASNGEPPRFALLSVTHAGVNNLPAGLQQQLTARLGQSHATGDDDDLLAQAGRTGYINRISAIRADVPWRPALLDGTGLRMNPKPTALGSQTAIVVGPDGSTASAGTVHTDHLGRIRIRFHWQSGESNTCWVRVAQLCAGPGYGAQFIPRIGQEVVVRFFDNDIDRPIVNGALYNGQGDDEAASLAKAGDHTTAGQGNRIGAGNAPAWHGAAAGEHGHGAFLSGFKSAALGADGFTRQSSQLVFDDSSGRLRTQMATDTAATQLNLGHLIHQADNYRGSFRGIGWELRSDAWGAIRASKGLLLTTYHGSAPGGRPEPAGDNTPAAAMLKQAQGFANTFNQTAQTHQTVQMIAAKGNKALNGQDAQSRLDAEQAPIAAMLKKTAGRVDAQDAHEDGAQAIPHSTAPLLTVAAQAGLGIAAADGLHVAANEAAHFTSGRDMHLAVGEALTVHSGQVIGILAGAVGNGDGDTGIKFYAAQGDVELQAQNDAMTLAAKDLVRLVSAQSHVDFAAAKSITLATSGGASFVIEGGNITFACLGKISIRAQSKQFSGPAITDYQFPRLPVIPLPKRYSQRLNVLGLIGVDEKSGQALLQGMPYKVTDSKGKTIATGITDETGGTGHIYTNQAEKIKVQFGEGAWIMSKDINHLG